MSATDETGPHVTLEPAACLQCGAPATDHVWLFTGEVVSVCDDKTCRTRHARLLEVDRQRFLNLGLAEPAVGGGTRAMENEGG